MLKKAEQPPMKASFIIMHPVGCIIKDAREKKCPGGFQGIRRTGDETEEGISSPCAVRVVPQRRETRFCLCIRYDP